MWQTCLFYFPARCSLRVGLKTDEAGAGVTEVFQFDIHAVHQAQVQAAQLAVIVALVAVVEDAPGFQRAAQTADRQNRQG